MRWTRWVGVIIFLWCGTAFAEDKAAARKAFIEGSKFYDLNQYAEALEAFKRAYWNFEDPVILYNIAQCHRALQHRKEAVDFYRSYLRKASDPPNRDEVQKIISDLETAMAQERTQPPKSQESAPVVVQPSAAATPQVAAVAEHPPRKRSWIWGVVGGVVIVGVALGVGLGVGLQSHSPSATDGAVRF